MGAYALSRMNRLLHSVEFPEDSVYAAFAVEDALGGTTLKDRNTVAL